MVTELIWKIACSINDDYEKLPTELKEKDNTSNEKKKKFKDEDEDYYQLNNKEKSCVKKILRQLIN
jgi:hypothetical protein